LLFAIRISFSALLLIFTSLIIPEFRLGGRYLILLEAVTIAFLAQMIRKFWGGRLQYRNRGLLGGVSVFLGLLLFEFIFPSVNLTAAGILISFPGMTLLEMLLPNQLPETIYQK
jgi:dolichol kinase